MFIKKRFLGAAGIVAVVAFLCIGCSEDNGGNSSSSGNGGSDDSTYNGGGGNPVGPNNPDNGGGGGSGTVKIGGKTWMAKNLNIATANSKCYNNSADSCAKYGRLYTWEDAKSACPSGWRLPSDAEWTALTDAVGGESVAGKKLKSKSGWSNNGNGTDDYGFAALPGGDGGSDGDFYGAGYGGYWWSSTEYDAWSAWFRNMDYDSEDVVRYGGGKTDLFSVRCVQD